MRKNVKYALFVVAFSVLVFLIIISNSKTNKYQNEILLESKKENNTVKNKEVKEDEFIERKTEESNLISLGEFKLTAYCPCSICCGKWSCSPTASGVMPTVNHTIAVDTSVIPFGTKVVINGVTYIAEDTGSSIKGSKIDIYFNSHQDALNFGVQYAEVFIINK